MLINEVSYDENNTDCIVNYIPHRHNGIKRFFHLPDFYYNVVYMEKLYKKFPNMPSKQIFKKVFGNQQKCVQYTYRNWVWTFSNEEKTATINCLVNETGVSWEMDITSNKQEIIKLRQEIERKLIK